MSVVLSFKLNQSTNCKNLTFYETTGVYSVSNITGWGTPNEATTDAVSAVLTVTFPDETTTTVDLFNLSTYPKSDYTSGFTISPQLLGLSSTSSLSDGVYKFEYTVETGTTTYTQVIQQALYCQINCCILSMVNSIDLTCGDCSKKQIEDFNKAYVLLKGLIYSSNCGNISIFNKNLEILQKLCNQTNCQNCN